MSDILLPYDELYKAYKELKSKLSNICDHKNVTARGTVRKFNIECVKCGFIWTIRT